MKNKLVYSALAIFFLSSLFSVASLAKKPSLDDIVSKMKTHKDIVKVGSDVVIPEGTIYTNATAVGGNLIILGEVKKDAVAVLGDVVLKSTAAIGGNVVSVGGKILKEGDVKIGGDITEVAVPYYLKKHIGPQMILPALILGWGIMSTIVFVGFLALACIIAVTIPSNIGYVSAAVEKRPWRMLGFGLLGMIAIPFVTFVMAVSLVGIPLIPVEVIAIVVALLVGYITIAQIVGKALLKGIRIGNQPMVLEVLVGMILVGLVSLLPIIGWLFKAAVIIMGFGGVIATKFATRHA